MNTGEVNFMAKGQCGEDCELMSGVDPFDVEGRVGFGIAKLLRFGQNVLVGAAGLAHRRQNVITRSVQNTFNA